MINFGCRDFITNGTDSRFDSEPYKIQEQCEWQLKQMQENIIINFLLPYLRIGGKFGEPFRVLLTFQKCINNILEVHLFYD